MLDTVEMRFSTDIPVESQPILPRSHFPPPFRGRMFNVVPYLLELGSYLVRHADGHVYFLLFATIPCNIHNDAILDLQENSSND